jgi:hypothetical protein
MDVAHVNRHNADIKLIPRMEASPSDEQFPKGFQVSLLEDEDRADEPREATSADLSNLDKGYRFLSALYGRFFLWPCSCSTP